MSESNHGPKTTRRDFLAATAGGLLTAGMPWLPRAAVAKPTTEPAPAGSAVAKVRIYPAIGICRVGSSEQYFLAPEVPGLPPQTDDFKDGTRKLKKQAQRFRVYAFDDQDRVIGEVTQSSTSSITWGCHLANTKAAWYGFNNPLDNGDLAPGLPGQKRNQFIVTDEQRESMLVIDGGKKTITGVSVNADGQNGNFQFAGTFWETEEVKLGQVRTDDQGRLLVIPPDGKSHSPTGRDITSFADNDGWHDDWCDGPVTASVNINGQVLEAESSWVACVGPNFAPEIPPISTMYDVVKDLNVAQGWETPPATPSFTKDIYPTLRRTALMEWVTNAANHRESWLDNYVDLSVPGTIENLANPNSQYDALRRQVLAMYRDPYKADDSADPPAYIQQRLKIPYMTGDGINYSGSPLQWFQFPKHQYNQLVKWANGDFIPDWSENYVSPITTVEQIALQDQPAALTEAALEPLSGGAFHPGVELTYYLRIAQMYARDKDANTEPFRITPKDRPMFVQNLGRLMTKDVALGGFTHPDGTHTDSPIGPQMAGDLTRWMGLPWQCDAFSCQHVLMQENYPTATWWPALLPIDVLAEQDYQQLMDTNLSTEQRAKFFHTRRSWSRDVAGIGYHANASYWDGITNMITLWERMGFVVKREAPKDADAPAGLPEDIFVEVGRADTMELRFDWKPEDGMLPL